MYELQPTLKRRTIVAVSLRTDNLAPEGPTENSPAIHRREPFEALSRVP